MSTLAALIAAACTALAVGLGLPSRGPGRRARAFVGARPSAARIGRDAFGSPEVRRGETGPARASGGPRARAPDSRRRRRYGALGAAACAGGGTFALLGGVIGFVFGIGVGMGAHRVLRRLAADAAFGADRRAGRSSGARLAIDLPIALDLLAAVLWTGAAVVDGLRAVGQAIDGPVGARFAEVVRLLELGATADVAWSALLGDDTFDQVARVFMRAGVSGAPLGDALERLAADRRESARATAEAAAHRLGVRAVIPLGLCFLPSFVLVGVVPVVVGLARAAMG